MATKNKCESKNLLESLTQSISISDCLNFAPSSVCQCIKSQTLCESFTEIMLSMLLPMQHGRPKFLSLSLCQRKQGPWQGQHQSPKLEVHRYEVLGLYHTVPKVVPHLFCCFITFFCSAVAVGCQTSQISIYEALQPTFTYQWSTGIFWSSSVRRSMARFLPKARTRPVKIWWLGTTPSFRLHFIFKHLSKPISHI